MSHDEQHTDIPGDTPEESRRPIPTGSDSGDQPGPVEPAAAQAGAGGAAGPAGDTGAGGTSGDPALPADEAAGGTAVPGELPAGGPSGGSPAGRPAASGGSPAGEAATPGDSPAADGSARDRANDDGAPDDGATAGGGDGGGAEDRAIQPDARGEGAASGDAAAGDEVAAGAGPRRPRFTAAGAFIGVLLVLLGFALVVQLRSNAGGAQLASERPEDLVQILSDLDSRQEQLRQEIAQLQATKQQLEAGSQSRDAALAAAAQRADELGILAGTLAARGPGVTVHISAGQNPVKASSILDMVEELRDAGAEAMQIDGANGGSVRIVASTYFVDAANGQLEADGKLLTAPFTMTVIGDPQTLQPAINIAGGVVTAIEQAGGSVSVTTPGTVTVSTTVTVTPPKYAVPAN